MKKSRRIFGIMVLFFCFLSFPVNHVFAASGMAEVSLRVTQNFAVKNPAKKMDFTGGASHSFTVFPRRRLSVSADTDNRR